MAFTKIKSLSSFFQHSAAIIASFSGLSYCLGLIRDRLLATTFGASRELDIYNTAFLVPDFLFNLFVAGAITSAFIPIFSEHWTREKKQDAWLLTNYVLNACVLFIFIIGSIAFITIPWITKLLAPGFDASEISTLITTTRILLLSPLLFAVSTTFGSALMATRRFFFYALSPVLYNLGIVLGIVLFAPKYGITGVVIGTVFGIALHLCARFYDIHRSGFRYQAKLNIFDPHLRSIIRLMIPKTLGLMALQGKLWAFNVIGSTLAVGSIAIFNLSRNLQSLIISLIPISLATAVFPVLSEHYVRNDNASFVDELVRSMKLCLFLVIPGSVFLFSIRVPLVSLLFHGGAFTQDALVRTSLTLGMFCLLVIPESMEHFLSRAFYSRQDTMTPVIISIGSMVVTIVSILLLKSSLQILSLPLGWAIGSVFQIIILWIVLRSRISNFYLSDFMPLLWRSVIISIFIGIGVYAVLLFFASRVAQIGLGGIIALGIFCFGHKVFKTQEWDEGVNKIKKALLSH